MPTNILGIATEYPPLQNTVESTEKFFTKWAKPSEALTKTLQINRSTRILTRPSLLALDDPILNAPTPPTIRQVNEVFMSKGVELGVKAARKALDDWGGDLRGITHLVCNTCTASAYPGFDHALLMALGLDLTVDRTLLHGVGCAGGLSALRLANSFAQLPSVSSGAAAQGGSISSSPPRILVVALEVTSTLVRSELEELDRAGGKMGNVGVCLFSDGASAMVVGGGELLEGEKSSFEVIKTLTATLPDTVPDLGFNVDECGWKAIISPRVPSLTSKAVPTMYKSLLDAVSSSPSSSSSSSSSSTSTPSFLDASDPTSTSPAQLDWLIHPGGASILAKIEHSLSLVSSDHTRASWEIYTKRGNTSSVSIGAVIERSRLVGKREGCVGVSFGPGVTVEGCLLRRTGWRGREAEAKKGSSVGMEVTLEPVSPPPAVGDKRKRDIKAEGEEEDEGEDGTMVVEKKRAMTNGHTNGHINGHASSNGNPANGGETVTKVTNGEPTSDIVGVKTNEPGKHEPAGVIGGKVNGIISGAEGFTRKLEVEADEGTTVP